MRLRAGSTLILLAALAACGRSDGGNEALPNGAVIPAGDAANVAIAPDETVLPPAAFDALAGVRIGMTVADMRAAGLAAEKDDGPDPDNRCGYARVPALRGLFFMLDGDRVVRIDVAAKGHPTLGGVEVGMDEIEVIRRLGKQARVLRANDRGALAHDVVVHEEGVATGLLIETDGRTVTSYRIGQWDAVRSKDECL